MKIYLKLSPIFLVALSAFGTMAFAISPIAGSDSELNKELWLEMGVSKKIGTKTTFALWADALNQAVPRFRNYDNYLEGSVKYQVSPAFSVEGMYRQEYSNETDDRVVVEKRPQVRAGYSFALGKWRLRNRHQYEWRFIDDNPVKHRYRTDFRVLFPVHVSKLNFTPYMQEEVFVADTKFKRSRCYLGMMGEVKSMCPSLYMVWQADRNLPDWDQRIGLGFAMEFKL